MDLKCETTHKLMYKLMYLRIKKYNKQNKTPQSLTNLPLSFEDHHREKNLSFVENISKPHAFVGMSQTH